MKILVAGEVKGRLDLLFTRVAALHASKAGMSGWLWRLLRGRPLLAGWLDHA